MPECDYCGKNCGNFGALQQHKNSCPHRPDVSNGEFEADEDPAAQDLQPAQEPATAQPKKAQPPTPAENTTQQANEMQTQEQAGHVGTGMQAAEALADVGLGGPEQKANATEKAAQFGAGLLARLGQKKAEQMRQSHQNAKQHAGEEIQQSQDYPSCAECGNPIAHVPQSGKFDCPHCGVLLEI